MIKDNIFHNYKQSFHLILKSENQQTKLIYQLLLPIANREPNIIHIKVVCPAKTHIFPEYVGKYMNKRKVLLNANLFDAIIIDNEISTTFIIC